MAQPLRVLLVEDNADDAELLVRQLRRAGYDPLAERIDTGDAMRAALGNGTWDLVLSDASLPQFSAQAALELLHGCGIDLPFIVVSGSIGEEAAVTLMKAGAHDYLFKENLTRLGAAVERELQEARERRERQRAELELRRSERRLAEAERLAHVGSWEVDLRAATATWSEEMCRILGVAPGDLGASLDALFERVLPEDRAQVRQAIEPVSEDPHFFDIEFRLVRPDGVLRYARVHGVATPDRSRAPVRLLGTLQDMTEQRSLELQFRQAQKLEAVGRLAGGVAHDFNNLLTVIMSYTDFVLEALPEGDPVRQDVEQIRNAGSSAARLTRQLLAFSRQQVLAPRVLDLNAVLSDSAKLLNRLLGEDIRLVTTLAPDIGTVKADAGQLEQVIMNLAVNARDAMPDGGQLTIETANVEMDEAYVRKHAVARMGRYVMLAITDTGVGMTEETKTHIFEPFFTTKESGKGTGLGLATVYGIVKQSGGFIWAYSEVGQGTTFKIYLPRADEPADRATPAAPTGSLGGTEAILVVDDAPAVRLAVRTVLERHGYSVFEAMNGEAAVELAAKHRGPLDLLITDVVMPGMSGRAVAQRLAAERPGLKVLYMSGYTDDTIVRHGVLEPGIRFIQKPFVPDVLAQRVREVLDTPR